MFKRLSLLLLTLALLLSFAGCGEVEIEDDPQLRAGVEELLDALLAGDGDAAYGAVYREVSRTQFDNAFAQMRTAVTEVETYELTPIQLNYTSKNGVVTIQRGYRMTTNDGSFVVAAARVEGLEGLTSFQITPEEQTTLYHTGTLGHMQGANVFQWALILLSLAVWGFVIWAFVDCCRGKFKWKPLWLVLVALGSLLVTLSLGGRNVGLNFNLGVHLTLSGLLLYGDGSAQLKIVIPLGAIMYLCLKKKLTAPPAPQIVPEPEFIPAESAEAEENEE